MFIMSNSLVSVSCLAPTMVRVCTHRNDSKSSGENEGRVAYFDFTRKYTGKNGRCFR